MAPRFPFSGAAWDHDRMSLELVVGAAISTVSITGYAAVLAWVRRRRRRR
jgi:hypothetical protein